jgi:hypothetical protein
MSLCEQQNTRAAKHNKKVYFALNCFVVFIVVSSFLGCSDAMHAQLTRLATAQAAD